MYKVLILAILAGFIATPAFAQNRCGSYQSMVSDIGKALGAETKYGGLNSGGNMITILVNEDKESANHGKWVALRTTSDGYACVVSHGINWTNKEPEIEGPDA